MKFKLFLITSLALGAAPALANDFENDEAYGYNETVTTYPDGRVERQVRRGKLKPRDGDLVVGEIYNADIERLNARVKARRFSSFSFGPYQLTNPKDQAPLYSGSYARHWESSPRGEIRLRLSGGGGTSGSFGNLGLGGAYLPSTGVVSPILGADFGFGTISGSTSASGFSASAFAGFRFFRTADAQLELIASYSAVFAGQVPGVFGIGLSVLF